MKGKDMIFYCTECGSEHSKWQGQCKDCKAWNTLQEQPKAPKAKSARASWTGQKTELIELSSVNSGQKTMRFSSGISEFDRALGGGIVQGSVVLLGGDPGIGKSTLILQTLSLCKAQKKIYVTGEESPHQVADRGTRLQVKTEGIFILSETNLETIVHHASGLGSGDLLVIDSIQTLFSDEIASAPGTVTQVRECAARLTRMAKQNNVSVILIGHVTKDGSLAGPRVLEHMVDAVLYFEGDPQSPHRLVRAFKNRFGAAQELGAFEMTEQGLVSIDNPSSMFLSGQRTAAGSCVFCYQEGTRPILLEVQALMDDMQGSQPKRLSVGLDNNRVNMLLAVLHKHGSLQVGDQDVFVNVVGGLRIQETASDLAVAMALLSSLRNKPLPSELVCFGEIGLTGELRPVQQAEDRLREAARLGFTQAIVPDRNVPKKPIPGITVMGAKNLGQALNALTSL